MTVSDGQNKQSQTLKTVLMVDDDSAVLGLMESILEGLFNVIKSSNPFESLKLLRDGRPDLVIVDIVMPGLDGFSLINEIQKFSDIPIIVVSGLRTKASEAYLEKLNVSNFLTKAELFDRLVQTVQGLLNDSDHPGSVQKNS